MDHNLSQYKIFYEVAKAGNISKAAKELYISQPAISKSISKLEDSLEVALFTRNSRGVQLTDEGKLLYNHTKAAFEELNRGELELKRVKDFNIGHLRIGVSNTLCKYILLPYLKGFIEKYPHIKISIESQSTSHTITMLEQQRIDLGLIAEPTNRRPLLFQPVMDIHDIFVATKSYLDNLYLREGPDADLFQTGNILLLDKNNMTRKYIDEYLNENQIVPNQLLEVTTMDILIEFAKIGLGIGCVIKEFVQEELDRGDLIQIPMESAISKRTVGFSYNPNGLSTAMENFFDAMRGAGIHT
ncbi:MAG TPA: LysR family transcriptional regulator [Lachnoclostridium sp.]|jgi:LysR family cyn operon transcriptional activator|uniref:LysR family transcriptional regulator n=1 Tax=Lacrimispora sp. TaxID=2719234 RepID=UPI000EC475A5|nr:LysR family transcriptional regulator [Lacrimispora sp.]HCD46191.1 LysR family transcriptional regulator [Lachnoclostridium sp.]